MNKNIFTPRIGIEIHCKLITKNKVFSNTPIIDHPKPNTMINNIDIAIPGTMPVINYESVSKFIKCAKILNCSTEKIITFKRKNYFYFDLPKGYQITQNNEFFAKNGYIKIFLNNKFKKINIRNIQLEEDTAKQHKFLNNIQLDFNRTGCPLVEIITEPDFASSKEVIIFVKLIQMLLKVYKISDASLEKGSFRVDANVSLDINNKKNNRVEIKNINTYSNIENAINKEIEIQMNDYLNNKVVDQVTKYYDEKIKKPVYMRKKFTEYDYFFINEPNLPILDVTDLVNKKNTYNFLEKYYYICKLDNKLYIDLLLARNDIQQLVFFIDDYADENIWTYIFKFVINTKIKLIENAKDILNFYYLYSIYPKNHEILNNNQYLNIIFKDYINNNISIEKSIEKINKNYSLNNDLRSLISDFFINNEYIVKDYKNNPKKYNRKIMGYIMKKTHGKCNAIEAQKIINEFLNK